MPLVKIVQICPKSILCSVTVQLLYNDLYLFTIRFFYLFISVKLFWPRNCLQRDTQITAWFPGIPSVSVSALMMWRPAGGAFSLGCHTSQEGGGQNESPEQLPILPLWDICYLIRSLFICLLKHPVGCRPAGEIVLLWSDMVRKWTEDGRRLGPNELWGCFHQQVPGGILHHLSALTRGLHCQVVPFCPGGRRGELIVRVLLWGLVRGCCARRRNSLERGGEIHFRWQITARGWTLSDYLVVN